LAAFALPVSAVFLILFALIAILGDQILQGSKDRLMNERLLIAQMTAGAIDEYLQEAISELEETSYLINFDPANPQLSVDANVLAHHYDLAVMFAPGVTLLDPTGRVLLSHPLGLYPPGADLSHVPHVAQALQRREIAFSEPFYDSVNHHPVVAVDFPIYNGGRFAGLLSGLLDLSGSELTKTLQRAANLSQSGHATLVNSQGQVLVSTLDLPLLSPGEHATFYRWAMAQRQPVVNTMPFELDLPNEPQNHLDVTGFVPLDKAPWG